VLKNSLDKFNRALCVSCQETLYLQNEKADEKGEVVEKTFMKCKRCGKMFSEPRNRPYCKNCRREIAQTKPHNPFSRPNRWFDDHLSDAWDSDHFD
jgi:hypothetical protein